MNSDKVQNTETTSDKQNRNGKIDWKLTFTLLRVVVGIALCASAPVFDLPTPIPTIMIAVGGLIAGIDLLISGIYSLFHEDYFNRNTVLLIVFIITFIIGFGYEGSVLLILTQIGLFLSDYFNENARAQIVSMTGLSFKNVHVFRGGLLTDCDLHDIASGDEIMVHSGEYFPVDCIITDGHSKLDFHLVDGVANVTSGDVGDVVRAGVLNIGSDLRCEVISEGTTTAENVLTLLSREEKAHTPVFVRYFQPIMLLFAVAVGLSLTIFGNISAYEAVHRALTIVILSSAAPAFSGIPLIRYAARAGLASRGVVYASDEIFRDIADCDTAVFCAEGTLTAGKHQVAQIKSDRLDNETFLKVAAHAMAYSQDPFAESIAEAYGGEISLDLVENFQEIPNFGVKVVFNGVPVIIGKQALMATLQGAIPESINLYQELMFMVIGNQFAGYMVFSDPVLACAGEIASTMADYGADTLEFVTSYLESTAEMISEKTGIIKFASGRGRDDRQQYVEQVAESTAGKMMYIYSSQFACEEHSDADFDICIGGEVGDLMTDRAEVIVTDKRPAAICDCFTAAKNVVRLSNASVAFVMAVKIFLIVFSVVGLGTLWFAATIECIATLFVKVFSTSAFHAKALDFFAKKSNRN